MPECIPRQSKNNGEHTVMPSRLVDVEKVVEVYDPDPNRGFENGSHENGRKCERHDWTQETRQYDSQAVRDGIIQSCIRI
jgi:hypothetical protein